MRILKMIIRCFAFLSMAVLIATREIGAAISLLAFSSASLGIIIGQNIEKKKTY